MKRKRRWFGILLAAVVLLAVIPQGALATETAEPQGIVEETGGDTAPDSKENDTKDTASQDDVQKEDASQSDEAGESDTSKDSSDTKQESVTDKTKETAAAKTEKDSSTSDKDTKDKNVSDKDAADSQSTKDEGKTESQAALKTPVLMTAVLLAASGSPQVVDVKITNFELQNLSHETPTSIYQSDTFYLAMDWDASAGGTGLHEGDYFDITLPGNMMFPAGTTASDFNLTDENGTVVATAHVTPGEGSVGGTVHVTFTDAVEDKYDVKGTMYIAARFDKTQITTGETNTFTVTVNGDVAGSSQTVDTGVVVTGPKELKDEYLSKWGESVYGQPDVASWWSRINHTGATLTNVVITDTMGDSGETYIQDSFRLWQVEYDAYGDVISGSSQAVDLTDKLTFSADGTSFTLNLGDLNGEQYRLNYRTTYTPGTRLRNNLKLDSTEQSKTYTATHISAESGGTGGGSLASKIKLTKVDATDTSVVLAGAVFEVTAPDGSTFNLTTGADGTVTSASLTQGTYTVKEITAPVGYLASDETFTLEVTASGGAVRTIQDEPITTDISGKKTWDDNNDQDGARPDSITIRLLANGTETDSKTVTAADNWAWSFTGLPAYENGEEISYSVTEDAVQDYTPAYDSGSYDITNTHTPGKTSLTVSKAWDDANNQDGIRPSGVTVKLLANGTDTGKTLELNEANNWTGSFTDLDEYQSGQKVTYSIDEVDVEGYTSEISGDMETGYTVTNRHEPEQTEVSGSKTWDDNNDQDGARPDSITIRLLANGTETDSKTVTADDDWSWSFTGLPKFENGTEISYSITEDAVSDYSTEYNGYDITNTHTPGKTSLTVSKAWDDANNQDGIRPSGVTVKLLANGTDTGKTLELNEANNWTGSFTDLDEYQSGQKVEYTVEEEAVTGYTAAISGDAETGFVVTNTHEPEKPKTPDTPKKTNVTKTPSSSGKTTGSANATASKNPKTGDMTHFPLYVGILGASLALLLTAVFARRRERE